jgi:2-polyprenyl-6-methoxyphenol hydroxylase-like FAD-dependent oxidoreductase
MNLKTPVLIVGAGPVGLALAGELGWRGISCVLVEKGDGSIYQPKMDLVGVRTMEFCRRWGIVPWVEDAPYPRDLKQDNVYVSSVAGYEFGREPMPSMDGDKPPPQSPQHRERCPQDMFDPVLLRFAQSFPHVSLRYHAELQSFEDKGDVVVARVIDPRTGEAETIEADYLVGCDGAASTVRQSLGIEMAGNPVLTYTTNAIFRCPNFLSLHDKGEAYRYIVIGPEGTWATIVAINGRDRYRFSIVGDKTMRTFSEDEVRALIFKAVGCEFPCQILSIVPWIRRELVADSYGRGRVFIAGDAAHLTSPTGAFGMNMGIQDAVGLGWKLAALAEGWGGPKLVPTAYEIERRPVAIRNVREASANLRRMLSPRSEALRHEAFEPGPAGAAARAEFGAWFSEQMRHEWYTLGIHLGYRYEGSPLIVPDGTPEPPDTVNTYEQTARPGHRAPHVWLEPGKSTLDLFGRGFVLLRFRRDAELSGLEAAARAARLPLTIVDIDHEPAARLYERALVLVRPDGHSAWRGDRVPADPSSIVDTVRGAA